jgi:hypothetical protein
MPVVDSKQEHHMVTPSTRSAQGHEYPPARVISYETSPLVREEIELIQKFTPSGRRKGNVRVATLRTIPQGAVGEKEGPRSPRTTRCEQRRQIIKLPSHEDKRIELVEKFTPSGKDKLRVAKLKTSPRGAASEKEGPRSPRTTRCEQRRQIIKLPSHEDEDKRIELVEKFTPSGRRKGNVRVATLKTMPQGAVSEKEGPRSPRTTMCEQRRQIIKLPSHEDKRMELVEKCAPSGKDKLRVAMLKTSPQGAVSENEGGPRSPRTTRTRCDERREIIKLPSDEDERREIIKLPSDEDERREIIELSSDEDERRETIKLPYDEEREEMIKLPSDADEDERREIIELPSDVSSWSTFYTRRGLVRTKHSRSTRHGPEERDADTFDSFYYSGSWDDASSDISSSWSDDSEDSEKIMELMENQCFQTG